jgi:hypothetical protein
MTMKEGRVEPLVSELSTIELENRRLLDDDSLRHRWLTNCTPILINFSLRLVSDQSLIGIGICGKGGQRFRQSSWTIVTLNCLTFWPSQRSHPAIKRLVYGPSHHPKKHAKSSAMVGTSRLRSRNRFLISQLVSAIRRHPWQAAPWVARSPLLSSGS